MHNKVDLIVLGYFLFTNNESSLLSPEIPKIRFLTKVQDNVDFTIPGLNWVPLLQSFKKRCSFDSQTVCIIF